ncbi:hypothetical protein KGD82_14365 [Nocardiopsis eucommiae]|uniref:Uncharacterized protein n=1 Tax=Nocardiopsis eucommiae TaxID=2831970 RepID=A0A975QJA1_9ACTN|nr:hypothetical protein KGD82_14365 [Nocardiopsis eucommiae]
MFTLNLMSARASQLSIVDMNPVNVSCADPTAVTVVHQPPSGAASYPGVVVDLNHHDPMLYISDEGPDQGSPSSTAGGSTSGADWNPVVSGWRHR